MERRKDTYLHTTWSRVLLEKRSLDLGLANTRGGGRGIYLMIMSEVIGQRKQGPWWGKGNLYHDYVMDQRSTGGKRGITSCWRHRSRSRESPNRALLLTYHYNSVHILDVYDIIVDWGPVSYIREIWFLALSCIWSHLLWSSCLVTYCRWLWCWCSLVSHV